MSMLGGLLTPLEPPEPPLPPTTGACSTPGFFVLLGGGGGLAGWLAIEAQDIFFPEPPLAGAP